VQTIIDLAGALRIDAARLRRDSPPASEDEPAGRAAHGRRKRHRRSMNPMRMLTLGDTTH
jgi:hypothetical protein